MDLVTALLMGVGLSAACGFRVFVPLLVMGIAHKGGHMELAESMQWAASWPAIVAFGAATAVEVGGYYVPWIDNLLDSIATPAAFVAGTLVTAAAAGQLGDISPWLQWGVGTIVGGGAATAVQGTTVLVRAASSLTTGGLGNPVVSTTEAASSTALSILAIMLPIIAGILLLVMVVSVAWWIIRRRRRREVATIAVHDSAPTP